MMIVFTSTTDHEAESAPSPLTRKNGGSQRMLDITDRSWMDGQETHKNIPDSATY